MVSLRRRLILAGAAASALPAVATVRAQSGPLSSSRPVRIVTGGSTGSAIDALTRIFAAGLQELWQQPVVVENRMGGSQLIAAGAVANSRPDGHTLLVATSTPFIQIKFVQNNVPVEVWRDFVPLTTMATGSMALVARADAPYSTIEEFVEYGRKVGKQIPYGSWGHGSGGHLLGEGLRSHTGMDLVHVAYRGEAAELTDLMGGTLEAAFLTLATAKAQSDGGKVKVLAVAAPQRDPYFPQGATFKEQGVPGLEVIGWLGVFAPAATPPELVEKLSRDMQQVIRDPALAEAFLKLGHAAPGGSPEAFRQLFAEDEARWRALAKLADLKPE